MLSFASKFFSTFVEISLWLNLIACSVVGYNMGSNSSVPTFLWVVGGALVGLVINIVYGGLLATFIKINENLESINADTRRVNSNIKDIEAKLANSNEPGAKPDSKEKAASSSSSDSKQVFSDVKPIFKF